MSNYFKISLDYLLAPETNITPLDFGYEWPHTEWNLKLISTAGKEESLGLFHRHCPQCQCLHPMERCGWQGTGLGRYRVLF